MLQRENVLYIRSGKYVELEINLVLCFGIGTDSTVSDVHAPALLMTAS
jgi:hypothetical protein